MRIDIVSVFPDYFRVLNLGLLGKAQKRGIVSIAAYDLRDWTHDIHHSVDDTPVGGGAGMVMKPEIWAECLDDVLGDNEDADASSVDASGSTVDVPILIFPNPSAPLFTQETATELSCSSRRLVFGCGRYEGIDARVPGYYRTVGRPLTADHGENAPRQPIEVREYSIGDYVLNGGEVAVCAMIEAITRLLPGFMGNPDSIVKESYTSEPLLEYPQYTRPTTWRGLAVPEILMSGDHGRVDRFRRDQSLAKTAVIRPDLLGQLECAKLSKQDRKTLIALGWVVNGQHPRKA